MGGSFFQTFFKLVSDTNLQGGGPENCHHRLVFDTNLQVWVPKAVRFDLVLRKFYIILQKWLIPFWKFEKNMYVIGQRLTIILIFFS